MGIVMFLAVASVLILSACAKVNYQETARLQSDQSSSLITGPSPIDRQELRILNSMNEFLDSQSDLTVAGGKVTFSANDNVEAQSIYWSLPISYGNTRGSIIVLIDRSRALGFGLVAETDDKTLRVVSLAVYNSYLIPQLSIKVGPVNLKIIYGRFNEMKLSVEIPLLWSVKLFGEFRSSFFYTDKNFINQFVLGARTTYFHGKIGFNQTDTSVFDYEIGGLTKAVHESVPYEVGFTYFGGNQMAKYNLTLAAGPVSQETVRLMSNDEFHSKVTVNFNDFKVARAYDSDNRNFYMIESSN